uniref:Uncharacterized protein n=1 Tax=Mola mola TaxID=94237 RepID=A0A3Q3WJ72_MOLML
MAPCPGALALPRAVLGSVLLLVLSSSPTWGESVAIRPSLSLRKHSGPAPHPAFIKYSRAILKHAQALHTLASAVLAWLLCVVKKKRQTEGTYRPSAEEQSGASCMAAPDALKLPKEERLI